MKRRTFIASVPLAAAAGLTGLVARPRAAFAAISVRRTVEFGEGGGNEFAMENPVSIGMRTGEYVDALLLNGVQHGGNGGGNPNQFALSGDDYWSEFEVHAGRYVDFVRFKSNSGIEVSGGGGGGNNRVVYKGVRILRIGGRSGDDLDHIKIEFVENYHPSTVIVDGATGVFDFQYGGRTIETYTEQNLLSAQAYERITEKSTEFTFNTSAEGEYFAKFSVSTGLKTTSSTKEDVKNSLQEALKQGVKSTVTLKDEEGTFLIGDIRIMQDSDGHYWVIPIHAPQWTKLSQTDFKKNLDGLYDFTSGAVVQTGMKRRQKYGLNILSAT
jgi:predicted lactoylglutathione lyase